MWLLPLPLPPEQRVHLPPGRHLFPWYFQPAETARLAELLTGLLAGVNNHLILPWSAARRLANVPAPVAMQRTLLVVTLDEASTEDAEIDEALACVTCPHAMLQIPHPRESGYGWQERYLKPALMTLIQDHIDDEKHPLASLNIAALPVRRAASFTTDALGLVELLEATVKHRLSRAAEGTSDTDYEASLYAEVGQRFAERLLRLKPHQVEAALEVLMVEGAGTWSDERFRTGAEALEEAGLAQVVGGSVSLGPMARRTKDARILAVLQERISGRLSISLPRRWVVETAPILDELSTAYSTNNLIASAGASIAAAAGPRRASQDSNSGPALSRRTTDQVRQWIRDGSDFKDRCRRAQDFLGDPDRTKITRTDPRSEYDAWLEPIRCEFTDEEWKQIVHIHLNDRQYDEPVVPVVKPTTLPPASTSMFKGFKLLEPKRFSSQDLLPRQIDAFLDRRGDMKLDLARWMTFAFNENLTRGNKPMFLDMLSWIWRSAVERPFGRDDARHEAHDVVRRCLADALKNGYERQRKQIEADALVIGLDVSGVVPAGDRPTEFLQKMRDGFEYMLDRAFPDARIAYEQAGAIARQRGDAFDTWVAFHGEEDAVWASIDLMDLAKEESQSLIDDYRRRRSAMEQGTKVKEWLEQARQLRERVVQGVIDAFVEQNRRRTVSGRSTSWSAYPHDYWTMFRDLETICAPPALQQAYVQPLIDLAAFVPEDEFRYRLQLGVDKSEKTEQWVSRITGNPQTTLEDQRKRDDALLREFTRNNTFKFERLRRLEIFHEIAGILRFEDLDWSLSFFLRFQGDLKDDAWGHRYHYVRALCSYADLETRVVVIDRLEQYASSSTSRLERDELARALRGKLPLEQWVGLHADAAERLVRLVLNLAHGSDGPEISDSDECLAWALFSVIRGVNRFERPLMTATRTDVRTWADHLLHKKLSSKRPDLQGAFNAAAHLVYLLAPDESARDEVVKEALAAALKGPMGVWISLVEAGVNPTGAAMTKAAESLWANLDESWEETMRVAKSNPHHAWPQVAFVVEMIRSGIAKPLSVAQERLLHLVQAAPEQLALCAEVLDPKFLGDSWQPFINQMWNVWGGRDGADPLAARMGAVDLLRRWVAHSPADSRDLPTDVRFLVDLALLAMVDESPVIANHAAYSIVGYAARVRSPVEVPKIVGALGRMAIDPRLGIRGAAAYAGTKLPIMNVADEIRAAAQAIDKALAEDPSAIIQRQRAFGELDAKHPPSWGR